jgi:hypothetical protein
MPPLEHLVGVHSMLTHYPRYRSSRRQGRLDDPTLLLCRSPQPPRGLATNPNLNRLAHNVSIC